MKDLKKKLETNKLPISELARRIGCDPSTLGRVVRGQRKPSLEVALKLLKYFGEREGK